MKFFLQDARKCCRGKKTVVAFLSQNFKEERRVGSLFPAEFTFVSLKAAFKNIHLAKRKLEELREQDAYLPLRKRRKRSKVDKRTSFLWIKPPGRRQGLWEPLPRQE